MEGQRLLRDLQPARDSKVLSISREYLLQQMGQLPRLCSPSTPQRDSGKGGTDARVPLQAQLRGVSKQRP